MKLPFSKHRAVASETDTPAMEPSRKSFLKRICSRVAADEADTPEKKTFGKNFRGKPCNEAADEAANQAREKAGSSFLKKAYWLLDTVIAGTNPFEKIPLASRVSETILFSPFDLAGDYLKKYGGDARKAARALVRNQSMKLGVSGFLTGLPGGFMVFGTVPLDIAICLRVQCAMVTAIAILAGHDPHDEKVKAAIICCVSGAKLDDVMAKTALSMTGIVFLNMTRAIPAETLKKINQAIGLRLATKFGTRGAVNLGKVVPVLGGITGGGFDAAACALCGRAAMKTFLTDGGARKPARGKLAALKRKILH